MKNICKYSILILLGVFVSSGCNKFDNINKNPNNPTDLSGAPSVQLTASELMVGYTFGGEFTRYTGLFDGQLTYNGTSAKQFNAFGAYVINTSQFEASWTNVYAAMLNFRDLETTQGKKGNKYYVGISQIMIAYTLGMSSDMWNKMPFTQALQGTANLQPAFDDQTAIYDSVFSLLDQGIANMNLSPANAGTLQPGPDDIVYNGQHTEWVALAHSLKARFYLHLRKLDNGNIAKALAEIPNGFKSSLDDAYFQFGSGASSANPMAQFLQQRPGEISYLGSGNPPSYADSLLSATSDPRYPFYIDTIANDPNFDYLGSFYNQNNSPVQIMTYAELQFIQAELSFINGDKSTAATAANAGTLASVSAITFNTSNPNQSTLNSAYIAIYGNYNAGNITLEEIMDQKYLALFTNAESFTDWRRTGYPSLRANPTASTPIPRRFVYSDLETSLNKNTPTVTLSDRVGWDVP